MAQNSVDMAASLIETVPGKIPQVMRRKQTLPKRVGSEAEMFVATRPGWTAYAVMLLEARRVERARAWMMEANLEWP